MTKVRGALWAGGGFDKVLGIWAAARANAIGRRSDAGAAVSGQDLGGPQAVPGHSLKEARQRRGWRNRWIHQLDAKSTWGSGSGLVMRCIETEQEGRPDLDLHTKVAEEGANIDVQTSGRN